MFDCQKYSSAIAAGYLFYDTIFCLNYYNRDKLMVQTYFHHVVGIIGTLSSIFFDGFVGSAVQLTTISELSTLNVNLRVLLSLIGLGDSTLYMWNGVIMTIVFFFIRVVYYIWVLAVKWPQIGMYTYEFWQTYDQNKTTLLKFCLFCYTLMAFL